MSCRELLRTQACLDGELDESAAAESRRHIADCAECREFSAEHARLSQAVRAERRPAPSDLRQRIGARLDREPVRLPAATAARGRNFWFGALSGTGASALAAAIALFLLLPPSPTTIADVIVDAHADALMKSRTIEVASSNHHTVKPWFAGRVPLSPPVADFAPAGFVLAGGRVGNVAGAPAAVVVYRHGAHEIDLFVWADRGSALPGETTRHGYHATFWKKHDLDFAAVSDIDKTELAKFSALIQSEPE